MFELKQNILSSIFSAACLFGLAAIAAGQEIGGSLGGSTGVFRPKNAAAEKRPAAVGENAAPRKTAAKTKTPAFTKPSGKSVKIAAAKSAAPKNAPVAAAAARRNQPRRTAPERAAAAPKPNVEDLFEAALDDGNIARDLRKYLVAEQAYRRAIKLKPRDSRAPYGIGNLYTDQQIWDEAEKYYRQAVALNAANAEAHIALSYVLVQPNRGDAATTRLVDAETAARRAIALDNDNSFAFDQLGTVLEARGIIGSDTENIYRRAIELDPNNAAAYAHLGRLLRKNGRGKDAAESYKTAIKIAADVPNMILVAEVLQSEQRFEESEPLLRRAVAADPTDPVALFLLGRALIVRKNFSEAETVLLRSIAVSPRTFAAYQVLGSLYIRNGRFADAEKIFLKSLPLASAVEREQLASANGFAGVGDGFLKRNQKSDALRAYRKARELDSDNAQLNAKITAVSK